MQDTSMCDITKCGIKKTKKTDLLGHKTTGDHLNHIWVHSSMTLQTNKNNGSELQCQATSVGSCSKESQRLHYYSNAEPRAQIDDLQQDALNRAGISPRCSNDSGTDLWKVTSSRSNIVDTYEFQFLQLREWISFVISLFAEKTNWHREREVKLTHFVTLILYSFIVVFLWLPFIVIVNCKR
jgi:hypothetical protein